ncbi:MAG: response regulator [Byssovorax sp.]
MITSQDSSLEQATSDRPTLPDAVPPRASREAFAGDPQADPEAARQRVLGVLAAGFAHAIEAELRLLDHHFEEQRELVEVLRDRSQVRTAGAGAEEAFAALVSRTADCWGALKRAQKVARRFASGTQAGAPERIDLAVLTDEVLSLAGPYLRDRRVEVELHAPRGHVVVGRRSELLQLLVHVLLGAAATAMAGAGSASSAAAGANTARARLAIEIRRQGAHEILSASFAESGGAVLLHGAAPRGSAVDLTLVRQIVGAHEGHVEMAASGVPCIIVLPAARTPEAQGSAGAAPKLGPPTRRSPAAEARPLVLWIDPDALFIEIMVHALPELDIRGTRSAAEAERLADQGLSPSLILCNVHLPDVSGPALHASIARRRPELAKRFVFVADGALRPDVASYLIGTGRSILMRPIDLDHVRALLSPPPAPPAASTSRARPQPDPRTIPTEPALPAARPLSAPAPAPTMSAPATPPAAPASIAPASIAPPSITPPSIVQPAAAAHPAVLLPAHMSEIVPLDAAAPPTLPKTEIAPRALAEGAGDQRLRALAHEIAEALRYGGPMKGSSAIAMLRSHGVDEAMGLAAIAFALSTGIIVRDPPPSTLLRAPNKHRSVLVVDDDYDLRQILRDILEDHGYDVETAENGAAALKILRASPSPPVVLLDLMMPVMDGWQLLEELRRDTVLAEVPVVVVTASRNPGPLAGVCEALSKPLDYFKLVRSIDRSLRQRASLSP